MVRKSREREEGGEKNGVNLTDQDAGLRRDLLYDLRGGSRGRRADSSRPTTAKGGGVFGLFVW
jgi:hypothetical protein